MDRADETRPLRLIPQGLADLPDQHVQAAVYDERFGPEPSVKVRLVEDPGPCLDQVPQQVEGLGRQVAFRLPAQQLARAWIDREGAEKDFHQNVQSLTNPYGFP